MNTAADQKPVPGYHGKYLRVDVSDGSQQQVPIPPQILRKYIGGVGLGTWLLLREDGAHQLPLAPSSVLAFIFSPLVGSSLTTSAKFAVVSKSPLTERLNDSLASSAFAIAGKRAGCDAIAIVGKAALPSILVIDGGQARLDPAGEVWGMTCGDAEAALRERYDIDFQIAVIGPAGERQVCYATISHDGRHAGRGGSGAVLGAKNIKAVVVRGSKSCEWAKPAELVSFAKELSKRSFGPATAKYRELGTATNLLLFNRLNTLPTRNFQQSSFEGAQRLAPETLSVAREHTRAYCAACTIGCEHIYSLNDGASDKRQGVRLEYENLFALGPLCGIDDPDIVLRASKLCDELGLDTISAGGTIAFAMECVERGVLDQPALRFGDGDALLNAIESIASREGFGDLLAEGSRRLAEHIGHDTINFAAQVKGLEIPGYEPRAMQTMALGFATGSRGADHNRSSAYEVDFSDQGDRRALTTDAVPLAIETEDNAAIMDSLIICKFLRGVFGDFYIEAAEMLNLVTGWNTTSEELHEVASRIADIKKLFNLRAGWTAAEDTLPQRFFESLSDDPAASLSREHLGAATQAYYAARGWTSKGRLRNEDSFGL
ncbi:MAG: aldehyde:ferredoxin oxidoreductase [Planctomycetaceae bacterium]|nr:aldehyde:ferredoxin oxidoreductase [Planctomycetaceae bacterium]